MEKELKQNFAGLIAYSFTERFQSIYKDTKDMNYLCERSEIFLQVFNTFKQNMVRNSDRDIKDLLQLLTKREFFNSLVNKGISSAIKEVSEIVELKEEIKHMVSVPVFIVGAQQYQDFFNQAQLAYLESNMFHEKRYIVGESIAKHCFYHHWEVLGEVFNRVFAKDYIQNLEHDDREKIPVIYKHTLSGQKYFSEEYKKPQEKQQVFC